MNLKACDPLMIFGGDWNEGFFDISSTRHRMEQTTTPGAHQIKCLLQQHRFGLVLQVAYEATPAATSKCLLQQHRNTVLFQPTEVEGPHKCRLSQSGTPGVPGSKIGSSSSPLQTPGYGAGRAPPRPKSGAGRAPPGARVLHQGLEGAANPARSLDPSRLVVACRGVSKPSVRAVRGPRTALAPPVLLLWVRTR